MHDSGGHNPITVVTPCLNDWESLARVLTELDNALTGFEPARVLVVDDGSTEFIPAGLEQQKFTNISPELLRLECNLGHQRAICIGIVEALNKPMSALIIMDSDGEDRPQDVPGLIRHLTASGADAVVAERRRRHAGGTFRALNRLFQWFFAVLTGKSLNFGNFMALTPASASRLAYMPESWSNIPTSLMRSRVNVDRIALDRGERFAGTSRLGLVGLINHGLGAISVYADVVFTRVIVASAAALCVSAVIGIAAIITRIASGTPLPGWFALATTAVALGSLVLLVTVTLLTFSMLAAKGSPAPPPVVIAPQYVAQLTPWSELANIQNPDGGAGAGIT